MEPLGSRLSTNSLHPETLAVMTDDGDAGSCPREKKAKSPRRTTKVSSRGEKRNKSRPSKGRISLATTIDEPCESLSQSKSSDSISNPGDDSFEYEDSRKDQQNSDDEIDENHLTVPLHKKNSDQGSRKSRGRRSGKSSERESESPLTLEEQIVFIQNEYQKNEVLEEKFASNHELDNTGIMNLSELNLTDSDIPTITHRVIREKNKCSGLLLRDNCLTTIGVKILVDALIVTKKKLKYLSLSNNASIGDEGIEHVVRLLKSNATLTFLALPNTGMTDRGVRLLSDVLCGADGDSSCAPVEKLHISCNKQITDESLDALVQLIEQNKTLKEISLQHCGLSDEARSQLKETVTKKRKKKFTLVE